ncbi:MAG: DUF3122 domain-containing protein [Cyanobacteria bacterium P01_H01_bin.121]
MGCLNVDRLQRLRSLFQTVHIQTVQSATLSLVVLLCLVLGTAPAHAALHQYTTTTGQLLLRSQQSIRDDRGRAWQVIFFKQANADDPSIDLDLQQSAQPDRRQANQPQLERIELRLVGFPKSGFVDRTQQLTLTSSGLAWTAPPVDEPSLTNAPNAAQYDFRALLNVLEQYPVLTLQVPLKGGAPVSLTLPPFITQEWRSLIAAEFERPVQE